MPLIDTHWGETVSVQLLWQGILLLSQTEMSHDNPHRRKATSLDPIKVKDHALHFLWRDFQMWLKPNPWSHENKQNTNLFLSISNHILVHNVEKPCSCNYCDRTFRYNSNLSVTMKYTPVRSYFCVRDRFCAAIVTRHSVALRTWIFTWQSTQEKSYFI